MKPRFRRPYLFEDCDGYIAMIEPTRTAIAQALLDGLHIFREEDYAEIEHIFVHGDPEE
jgi:hypothetical protein